MSSRLTLICHATTAALRAAAFPLDEPLDDAGAAKAATLAGVLKRPERIWTSPAQRAQQTAVAMGLEAVPEPALADCDFGRWTGRTFDDIATAEPEALAAWTTDPTAAPHGGESVVDLVSRLATWLEARRSEKGHAVAITHAAVIRAAVIHAIAAPAHCFWRIDVLPLSRTELRPGPRWTLRSIGILLPSHETEG